MGVCDHAVCCAPPGMSVGSQNRRVRGGCLSWESLHTAFPWQAESRLATRVLRSPEHTTERTWGEALPTTHGACRFGRAGGEGWQTSRGLTRRRTLARTHKREGRQKGVKVSTPTDPVTVSNAGGSEYRCRVQYTGGLGPGTLQKAGWLIGLKQTPTGLAWTQRVDLRVGFGKKRQRVQP